MNKLVCVCCVVCVALVAFSAGKAKAGLPVRASFRSAVRVNFMPRAEAPPPPVVIYPASWSNELDLVEAAVEQVRSTTNLFENCWFRSEASRLRRAGDTAALKATLELWARERDALVRYWIDDFRTNGIPEKYRR